MEQHYYYITLLFSTHTSSALRTWYCFLTSNCLHLVAVVGPVQMGLQSFGLSILVFFKISFCNHTSLMKDHLFLVHSNLSLLSHRQLISSSYIFTISLPFYNKYCFKLEINEDQNFVIDEKCFVLDRMIAQYLISLHSESIILTDELCSDNV